MVIIRLLLLCAATMRTSDFDFELADALIAQVPLARRTASRLLSLTRDDIQPVDGVFTDIVDWMTPQDLLVMNNTRVIPARLFGHKATGGKVEILLESIVDEKRCLAQMRFSGAMQPGSRITLEKGYWLSVSGRNQNLFELSYEGEGAILSVFYQVGHMPLPPYIKRPDDAMDFERYQTVYAQAPGAVAAPTAGLHFDQALLDTLSRKGIQMAHVTLHVGAGTFQPVRVEQIKDHVMHEEWVEVSDAVVSDIHAARQRGGRIIAVGTTSLRALESAARDGDLHAMQGMTDIFIYPGYQFQIVDALITNFHLPRSSLLMLVSAFAGHERIMNAYRYAVRQKYRFFSYGDAMLIEHCPQGP